MEIASTNQTITQHVPNYDTIFDSNPIDIGEVFETREMIRHWRFYQLTLLRKKQQKKGMIQNILLLVSIN